jgi:proton-dependent oligopeptide transporter, POT family
VARAPQSGLPKENRVSAATPSTPPQSPLREIVQPFIDLVYAPRALWAINLNYLLEGFVYFGMLIYLAMYFNQYVGLGDVQAGWMVGVLTSGITISMLVGVQPLQ